MPKKSHIGAGIVIGAALGVATGLFLQSKKGKAMAKDASKKTAKLQAHLMKGLKNVENMTKDDYQMLVDNVTAYYVKAKEISKREVPQVKKVLMQKWDEISKEMKKMK